MKKLNQLKLNEKIDILDDQKMKMVTGGYSDLCPGQFFFRCTLYKPGGGIEDNLVCCADSICSAEAIIVAPYYALGICEAYAVCR